MKKYIYLIVIALLISACSKKNDVQTWPPAIKAVIKDAGTIPFKIAPLANDQVKVSLRDDQQQVLSQIMLKQDTTTLQTLKLNKDNLGAFTATFNYAFKPGVKYNFKVQALPVSDTIRQYTINNYSHRYVQTFAYKKLLELKQSLGPDAFDLSPSRNFLFITDDVNNVLYTKRLSLKTFAAEDINNKLPTTFIRAVSDDELLVYGDKNTTNVPAFTSDPGSDRVVLAKYNVNTKQSTFVDFVSRDYGRISRIVNNHVLVTNPIFEDKTASLINLADLSKVKYSLNYFDFTRIHEYSFGHILYANKLVSTTNGSMSVPVNLDDNSGIIDIDDNSGYALVSSVKENTGKDLETAFSVYKDNTLVYQSDYQYGRSASFPIIANIKNDELTFYQHFTYNTTLMIDGYYTLNLKTKEIKLVQADSTPFLVTDYQLKDGTIISVKADGVYKLTPMN
jgi:hypothetical protein